MTQTVELLSSIHQAYPLLKALSDLEMEQKPAPDKWSKKEILGHLVDSCINNQRRFLLASQQSNLIFDGYDQDLWVKNNDYQNRPILEIIEVWKWNNIHLASIIDSIPANKLNHTTTEHCFDRICMRSIEPEASTNLSYLVEDYIFHLVHHLNQILNT